MTYIDHKTVFEPYPTSEKSPLEPQKVNKSETHYRCASVKV